jgi:hypothetical protein
MKLARSILVSLSCLFFSLAVFSQLPVKYYEPEWKKVNALLKRNLPKSALEQVKNIYTLAKKEKQDAQVIKALVYMAGLQQETREDNEIVTIAEINKELAGSREPVASILKSIQAEIYWNYYEEHRWQLYSRTNTEKFVKEDIATWTTDDFHRKISELYLQSIAAERLLQQTRLAPFDAILIKGNTRHLRPTLYDFLAHRALQYFENDERNIKKPAYAFEINDPAAFEPAAWFARHHFVTRDSLSLEYKALQIYQKLIAFHLPDTKVDALIDADIQRIVFVKEKSVHPDKDKLYFDALSQLARHYGKQPTAAQAWYLLAKYHNEKADTYKPYGDTTHRYERIKARDICLDVLKQKDSSEGLVNCYNLLKEINSRDLQISVEKVNLPELAFRASVKFKNIGKLYLKLVRVDAALKEQLEKLPGDRYWPYLVGAPSHRSWQQTLPATNDLQSHRTEIKIDGLAIGNYVLVVSDMENAADKKSMLAARNFYVSGISYVNSGNDYFVLDRQTGQPLRNSSIQVWEQSYDYKQSKYVKEKGKTYTSNTNGYFRMDRRPDNRQSISFTLDVTHGKDRLFFDELASDYYYRDESGDKTVTSVFLFTDRSLYRPGQTVFYKGIVLSRNTREKTASIRAGYTTMVYLRDVNYKIVDSLKVTTNEFGSFQSRFVLPASGLNGYFSIYTKPDNGQADFRVEEYKRPKFFVDYEPIKGTYKVNDKIRITGIAKAYAGNLVDGAMVKYRVVRKPRFIYWWVSWRWWQPRVEEMEITQGETKTGKDGKFQVEFTAIPDLTIERKFEPVFDYYVYADVTDINGETRSGEKTVTVGYKSLILQITTESTLPADSLKQLNIRTQNMNGEHEPAMLKVSFTRLKEEKRLIRDRYWERPDQFVMSKDEYIRNFPRDEYDNENDYRSWEKGAVVFNRTDSSRANGKWPISGIKLEPGFYLIEVVTKDKQGEEVKDIRYIELYDKKSKQLNRPDYLWTGLKKTSVEPGETARVELGTAAENLFVIQMLEKNRDRLESPDYSFSSLSNEKKIFSFEARESDRGGFGTGWMFIRDNRLYQYNQTIEVPWTNKDLVIEYMSFREKTLPGSEEKWKVRISGYKKEKVAAEMLAAMYDASLDQFYSHNWHKPAVWPYYYMSRSWNGRMNFALTESQERYPETAQDKTFNKFYDQLLASYVFSPYFKNSIQPLFWENPLDYIYGEMRNPRLMRLPKPVMSEAADGMVTKGVDRTERKKDGDTEDEKTVQKEAQPPAQKDQGPEVVVRKNFNETAFFLPELRTDSSGAIEFSFTLPEALTRWKFMAITHTKEAAFGSSQQEIVTQKDLMVQPNPTRFLREGDKIEFSSKIVNLSSKELTGTASLQLFDAATNEPVDGWFRNMIPNQYFTVAPGESEAVKFPVEVPYQFNKALVWRIVAKSGAYSDGEENALPVLTNRMLVTETLPLWIRNSGTKNFSFDKLLKAGQSETLQHYAVTVEYTSNPAWYAVQALPYLMEYPYECAEQTWNRYYANALATHIANASPRIKQIFEQWKQQDTAALMSTLQKNQELKAILLEETPWVLDAKNEAQQKKNIALLFDMVRMSTQLNTSYDKLKQMQSSNGGFVWFTGGPDDRYITQYIVTGIGHLLKLSGGKSSVPGQDEKLVAILNTAIPYLDRKIKEDYDELVKNKVDLKNHVPGYTAIQYLYMRSFFPNFNIPAASQTAYQFFRDRAQKTWVRQSKYMQGMIALALHRTHDTKTPAAILASLKETAIVNDELGMYWKDQRAGWYWYEAPIETHSLLIEVFQEAGKDIKTVDDLKTWLLKNKQTNNWRTTKATAEACYALLLQGSQWLATTASVEIKLGTTQVKSAQDAGEAGTGFFKKTFEGSKVKPDMGNISVTYQPDAKSGTTSSWGAVYWQYFEDLDKITTAATPLKLTKKLFIERNSDRGPVLSPVQDGQSLKVGDKIKVRIELRADRDMEYVHMKDMRAAALEPVNVLSQYKWQGGLGYYESTKDASTNFFFDHLRKGTYVFEYTLFVSHTGNFSNGVTMIQCMYAPEFTSHSEGIRIVVE